MDPSLFFGGLLALMTIVIGTAAATRFLDWLAR